MMKMSKWSGLLLVASLLSACTEVDLCDAGSHPHRTLLDFRYHWDKKYEGLRTDSMRVVAVRPVNLMRYEFRVSANEQGNKGIMLSPETERMEEVGSVDSSGLVHENDCLWVRSGNYKFVTYTVDHDWVWDERKEEDSVTSADMSDLVVSYKPFQVDDPRLTGIFGSWKTYNTYSDYVLSGMKPLFFGRADYIDVPVVAERETSLPIHFTPVPVTQHLQFAFTIEKEEGIVVDSITAEIAGVSASMQLATGLVRPEKSYKMLFKMGYPALSSRADSAQAVALDCKGEVDVIGLVRSAAPELRTGPGILQIAVYSHVKTEATDALPPLNLYKIFYAGINLFHTLSETKLLEWEEEEEMYSQTCHEAVLEIGAVLKISKDAVLNGGSGSTGLDEWFVGDDIDLDV